MRGTELYHQRLKEKGDILKKKEKRSRYSWKGDKLLYRQTIRQTLYLKEKVKEPV